MFFYTFLFLLKLDLPVDSLVKVDYFIIRSMEGVIIIFEHYVAQHAMWRYLNIPLYGLNESFFCFVFLL